MITFVDRDYMTVSLVADASGQWIRTDNIDALSVQTEEVLTTFGDSTSFVFIDGTNDPGKTTWQIIGGQNLLDASLMLAQFIPPPNFPLPQFIRCRYVKSASDTAVDTLHIRVVGRA